MDTSMDMVVLFAKHGNQIVMKFLVSIYGNFKNVLWVGVVPHSW
jgi:hypothetical protein